MDAILDDNDKVGTRGRGGPVTCLHVTIQVIHEEHKAKRIVCRHWMMVGRSENRGNEQKLLGINCMKMTFSGGKC